MKVEPNRAQAGRGRYCSWDCRARGHLLPSGYRQVRRDGRQIMEHRWVMEQQLGRALEPEEIVHHRDGNRANNSPENLQLLASHAEHRRVHTTTYRDEGRKECSRCHVVKPRAAFYANRLPGHDPSTSWCIECYRDSRARKPP